MLKRLVQTFQRHTDLLLFRVYSDDPVHPSWLHNLSPSPKLESVEFKCTFTEFPSAVVRRLLGNSSLSEAGELNFPIEVKVPKQYELDLWNLKLEIAKEQGLLSNMKMFTNKVLTTIPALLSEAVGLITLNCTDVLCTDFPDTVLRLPNLMNVEGKGDGKPDVGQFEL